MSKKPPPESYDESLSQGDEIGVSRRQQDDFKKQERARMRKVLNTQIEDFSAEVEKDDLTIQPLTREERGQALKAERKVGRKRLFKRGAWAIGAGLFIWLLVFLFASPKQGVMYGLCKVFLEQQVRYPEHLRYREAERVGGNSIRIWFRQVGPYGEHRMESMRCYFRIMEPLDQAKYGPIPPFIVVPNPARGPNQPSHKAVALVLDKVQRNRRPYYPERVDAFNRSIISVLAYPPDLVFPPKLPDSLQGLRFDTRSFYKVRL